MANDMGALTRLAYASLSPLETRIRVHRECSEHADDIEGAVIEAAGPAASATLLDVGCGTGSFLRRLAGGGHTGTLVGMDTSPAAVGGLSAADGVGAVLADAEAMPFGPGSFDVVTARHMLYHVPDPLRAIREARRVLRPGGVFAATVNIEHATPMLHALVADTMAAHGLEGPVYAARVSGQNLPGLVERVFGRAETRRHDNALVLASVEPVIAYAVSCLPFGGVTEDDPRRPAIVDTIAARARDLFAGEPVRRDPTGYVVVTAVA